MASGETYYNPVSRTRMTFVVVPEDSGGRELVIDWIVAPGERPVAAAHYHAGPDGLIVETFQLLDGSGECKIDGKSLRAEAPHLFEIPCNAVHVHPRNVGGKDMHLRQRIFFPDPQLATLKRVQAFFDTVMALSQQGKVNRNGDIRNPLQAALTIHDTLLDPSWLPVLPRGAQRLILGTVANLALRLGYEARLKPIR